MRRISRLLSWWVFSALGLFKLAFTGAPRPSPVGAGCAGCVGRVGGCWRQVVGGIDGQSFENEGLMKRALKRLAADQQREAERQGLKVDPKLLRLEVSNDFVKFAAKHGAEVKPKGTAYWRVQKGQVWWAFSTARQRFRNKETLCIIILAFKAMGIAFK